MKSVIKVLLLASGLAVASTAVMADGHLAKAVKARQAVMQLNMFNIGILGGMAKGVVKYDAKQAAAAAGNLKVLTTLNGGAMWLPGSGNDNPALKDKTNALPAIWSTYPAIVEKSKALAAATGAMADAAGNGLDALRASIGAVGKACGSCHETFRAKMP